MIPLDQQPDCPADTYTKPVQSGPYPADPYAPQCKLKVETQDLTAFLKNGGKLSDVGLSIDPPNANLTTTQITAAATNGTTQYSWAQNIFSSSSNNAWIDEIDGTISLYQPTLLNGANNWLNYHYYNRLVAGSSTQGQCGVLSKITVGMDVGRFNGQGPSTPQLVGEYYTSQGCVAVISNLQFTGNTILFRIVCGNFSCSGQAWLNNAWMTIVSSANTWPSGNGQPNRFAAGHELWALNGDKANIKIPVNFVDRLRVSGFSNSFRPWSDLVLVAPLQGGSSVNLDAPFGWLDAPIIVDDFTSFVAQAN